MVRKKKQSKNGTPVVRKKGVYCPMPTDDTDGICGTIMRYIKTKNNQHARDSMGVLIEVARVFYACPDCYTVAWMDYRKDGKKGELFKKLKYEERFGKKLSGY